MCELKFLVASQSVNYFLFFKQTHENRDKVKSSTTRTWLYTIIIKEKGNYLLSVIIEKENTCTLNTADS